MPADLLSERFAAEFKECWKRERTATPVRAFAVRLHATGCSLIETEKVLRLLGVTRSYQATWQRVPRLADSVPDPASAQPTRVAVDETAVTINGEWMWAYAAIDFDSKVLLGVDLFERRGTDPATEFLRQLTEKHDLSATEFLVDGYGYLTALSRLDLSGHLDYVDRNLIETWFHTLKMRVDRFHNSWVGSRTTVAQWLALFAYYYNFQRPHQALDDRTPAEALNQTVPARELLEMADTFRGVAPVASIGNILLLQNRAASGQLTAEFVLSTELVDAVRDEGPDILSELSDRGVTRWQTNEHVPFGVYVIEHPEGTQAVVEFRDGGVVTGLLIHDTDKSVSWATEQFRRYRQSGIRI
jgi:transposase-like protein